MVSRGFYISMQLRYKSLCITNNYITLNESSNLNKVLAIINNYSTLKEFSNINEVVLSENEIDVSKNFISTFGKFYSKM